ncbi:hypothetical protein [Dyadobacter sp. MSC1_007]|uniref:hypothetical protein n=1 Tax=Dyadobacter sp. MSC1_007 TaxID=2909264 RepID=UPI002030B53D|nr:hypothetical protein [Dyadobacter sp. MSC1_007]
MKKKTLDASIRDPNKNSNFQEKSLSTIRSDPAVCMDHLVDVREAKRLLKTVSAQKLYYHCTKGYLPFIRQAGKIYFSEAVLRHWHHRIESREHHKLNH